jgi:hypothetical protein
LPKGISWRPAWVMTATHRGEWPPGVKPTNKPVRITLAAFIQIGLIRFTKFPPQIFFTLGGRAHAITHSAHTATVAGTAGNADRKLRLHLGLGNDSCPEIARSV